jgi:tripartite-type tricarboxylate transporter receptor subunit TctC
LHLNLKKKTLMIKKLSIFFATLVCFGALPPTVLAQPGSLSYPTKPIHIIVPYAAGGGVDNITRVVVRYLTPLLGQPLVIENKAGANGNIGADFVAKSAPDGYTFLMGASFLSTNRATMSNLPYDAKTDLIPVARAGRSPSILVVSSDLPVKNVSDLVNYVRANPDKTTYGVNGIGSPPTLMFIKHLNSSPIQVLYKGGSLAIPDLLSQRLTFMVNPASEVLPQIQSGKLKALAVTGTERFFALPEVPTMGEAGVPNDEFVV